MTRNAVLTLYATSTIALIVLVVTGVLVRLGWRLGIIESVSFSCGIYMRMCMPHKGHPLRLPSAFPR